MILLRRDRISEQPLQILVRSAPLETIVSWRGQRLFEARTAETEAGMPGGRIDTRSPHPRFRRRDKILRSILLPLVHRTSTVCARTFGSFDLPLSFLPLQVSSMPKHLVLDVAPFARPT